MREELRDAPVHEGGAQRCDRSARPSDHDSLRRARSLGLATPELLRREGLQLSSVCKCGASRADQAHLFFERILDAATAARFAALGARPSDSTL
eukprot:7159183-Alexandrium_andersonii.AAC.1